MVDCQVNKINIFHWWHNCGRKWWQKFVRFDWNGNEWLGNECAHTMNKNERRRACLGNAMCAHTARQSSLQNADERWISSTRRGNNQIMEIKWSNNWMMMIKSWWLNAEIIKWWYGGKSSTVCTWDSKRRSPWKSKMWRKIIQIIKWI